MLRTKLFLFSLLLFMLSFYTINTEAQTKFANSNIADKELSVVIASGSTQTNPIQLLWGKRICLIKIPASFSGTQISFKSSVTGTPDSPIKVGGVIYTIAVAPGDLIQLDMGIFYFVENFRIVSNASEVANRTILLKLTN